MTSLLVWAGDRAGVNNALDRRIHSINLEGEGDRNLYTHLLHPKAEGVSIKKSYLAILGSRGITLNNPPPPSFKTGKFLKYFHKLLMRINAELIYNRPIPSLLLSQSVLNTNFILQHGTTTFFSIVRIYNSWDLQHSLLQACACINCIESIDQ